MGGAEAGMALRLSVAAASRHGARFAAAERSAFALLVNLDGGQPVAGTAREAGTRPAVAAREAHRVRLSCLESRSWSGHNGWAFPLEAWRIAPSPGCPLSREALRLCPGVGCRDAVTSAGS